PAEIGIEVEALPEGRRRRGGEIEVVVAAAVDSGSLTEGNVLEEMFRSVVVDYRSSRARAVTEDLVVAVGGLAEDPVLKRIVETSPEDGLFRADAVLELFDDVPSVEEKYRGRRRLADGLLLLDAAAETVVAVFENRSVGERGLDEPMPRVPLVGAVDVVGE